MVILACGVLFGQNHLYKIYDSENGLPSSEVYKVFKDSTGNLWFCTDRGVCRFNNTGFKIITTGTMSSDIVFFTGYCDKRGVCWFEAMGNKYFYLENDKLIPAKFNTQLSENYPTQYLTWRSDNPRGTTFEIQTQAYGLCYIQLKNNHIDTIDVSEIPENKKEFNSVDIHIYFEHADPQHPRGMTKFRRNKLAKPFFYEYHGDKAILHLDISNEKTKKLIRSSPRLVSHNKFVYIYNNRLFLGSTTENHLQFLDTNEVYTQFQSTYLLGDRLYIGTIKRGLYYYDLKKRKLQKIDELNNYSISSICSDAENNLWVSTTEKGVFTFPAIGTRVPENNGGNIRTLSYYQGNLYVGYKDGNFGFFDNQLHYTAMGIVPNDAAMFAINPKGTIYLHGQKISAAARNLVVSSRYTKDYAFFEDRILYTLSTGFMMVDPVVTSKYQAIYDFPFRAFCLHPKSKNTVYIGGSAGLFSYQYKTKQLTDLRVTKFRIADICPYGKYLLLGTLGDGVYIYDTATNQVVNRIREVDGLSSNLVNAIRVSTRNEIWVASNHGLNRVHLDDQNRLLNIRYFDRSDGLPGNEVNVLESTGNLLFVGTTKGLGVINTDNIQPVHYRPMVSINSLEIIGEGTNRIHDPKFTYQENNLLFHFSAFIYSRSLNKQTYAYALLTDNTNDTAWNFTNENELQFTNMRPGRYTLLLKARSRHGGFGKVLAYPFEIIPKYTQTFGFKVLVILLSILALAGIVFIIIRNVKNRETLQRRIKEAQLESLRNQMNPHFIFNALNSIQNFILGNNPQKANDVLGSFSMLFRETLNYSAKDFITIREELDFMKRYLEIEKMRFSDIMEFHIECSPEINQDSLEIPPLLMQPLVENAIKHGLKHIKEKGTIDILLRIQDDMLLYTVKDNGMGFSEQRDEHHISRGIAIIKDRIDILNQTHHFEKPARLDMISIPGMGVNATIALPLSLCTGD